MQHYSMVFHTNTGGRRSMRINNPNTDLSLDVIKGAIDQIIQNDVFDQARGALEGISRMELTRIEQEVLI